MMMTGRIHKMKIGEYKVMKSQAGYYVGREFYDDDFNAWMPYSRNSDYYASKKGAKKLLDLLIKTYTQNYQRGINDQD